MQRFHPKALRFPHLFPASVGQTNGRSGGAVILASWSPTPRRSVIRITIQRATRPISSITIASRSEEHTSELQSRGHLVCRLLLEKKKKTIITTLRPVTRRPTRACNCPTCPVYHHPPYRTPAIS